VTANFDGQPAYARLVSSPGTEVSTTIAATPLRVWRLVSDIELMPRLSSELQSVEWLGGDGPRLGAQFVGINRHSAIGEWTTQSEVIEWEAPRVFAWAVGGRERPAAIWRFTLTPMDHGTTLTYRVQLGPGRSGVTLLVDRDPDRETVIVAARLRQFDEAMTATVEGIRTLAEASTADSQSRF
jgi:uncharacterized protein YndB with AHSA1/START domain